MHTKFEIAPSHFVSDYVLRHTYIGVKLEMLNRILMHLLPSMGPGQKNLGQLCFETNNKL